MSLSAELKRRLEVDDQPLSKRLRLAENVLSSPFFPAVNREETVIQWICSNLEQSGEEQQSSAVILSLKTCLKNSLNFKKFTSISKSNLIKILSNLLVENTLRSKPSSDTFDLKFSEENIHLLECCLILIENTTMTPHFQQFINEYFTFLQLILKNITHKCMQPNEVIVLAPKNTFKSFENDLHIYVVFSRRALNDLQNFTKSFSKKALLVDSFIETNLLNIILEMSNDPKLSLKSLSACQFILFPTASLAVYKSYLTTILCGSNLSALIEEKGESLRPVVKVIDVLLKYDNGTDKNCSFITDYVKLFIYSCSSHDSLVFMFNILLTHCLGIRQEYVKIQGDISSINISDNMIKHVYLQNLKYLSEYNVNLNSKYAFISNETTQSEALKGFIKYLQEVILNILLDDSTANTDSLLIINQAFKLDPAILETNLDKILPAIMIEKKTGSICDDSNNLYSLYISVMIATIEIHFKLSRGAEFILKVLPQLKAKLESIDRAQEKLILKQKNQLENGEDSLTVSNKIILSEDIISEEFCNIFGKLGSTLTSWQNIELFKILLKYLNEYGILQLGNQANSPSVVLLIEILSSWISSCMDHNKMADQNIPEAVVQGFVDIFENFGSELLSKFGSAILILTYNNRLLFAFLKLCHSYGQLKLLLLRYQPYYDMNVRLMANNEKIGAQNENVSNVSMLHSYLSSKQWKGIFKLVTKNSDEKCTPMLNCLILQKITTFDLFNVMPESVEIKGNARRHTFENLDGLWLSLMSTDYNTHILFSNLNTSEIKMASSKIVLKILEDTTMAENEQQQSINILKMDSVKNNQDLLSAILIECNRSLWRLYDKPKVLKNYKSIFEASDVENFDLKVFFTENIEDINVYCDTLNDCHILKTSNNIEKVIKVLDLLREIPIEYLKENYQVATLFSIFLMKMATHQNENEEYSIIFDDIESKCDRITLRIFELSYKAPNLIYVFPPNYLFQCADNNLFELTTFSGGKYNISYKVLKFIFDRTVTKENIKSLKCVVKYLTESCLTVESTDSSGHVEKLLHGHFQILSVLLIHLANTKKGNLPSEIKVPVMKYQKKIIDAVHTIFNSVKWKSIDKKTLLTSDNVESNDEMRMDVDEPIKTSLEGDIGTTSNESNSGKLTKNDTTLGFLNLLESFAIILKLDSDINNQEESKTLARGIGFLTDFALAALSDTDVCFQHAKGACALLNVALRNDTYFKDQKEFHLKVWKATLDFMENDNTRSGSDWMEISNSNQENIKLIFEICEPKLISQVMTKQLLNFTSQLKPNITSTQMTRKVWSCFLNSNFKVAVKNEARSNLVKQMCWHFFFWLRNNSSTAAQDVGDSQTADADEGFVDGKSEKRESIALTTKNVEVAKSYFEVMTEFVGTKKMVLSHSIIDILLQMPVIINFDVQMNQSYGNQESLRIFCVTFEKCTLLINSILLHRSELLQDRWPCFMQIYRKLIKNLSIRSNSEKVTNNSEIEKLVSLALSIEKLTQTMVMKQRQDLARISSYLVADIVGNFQKTPVCPAVKFHLQNCAYSLLQLLDTHSIGFIMRNMTDSSRIMFQRLYDNYNKYYKYTGKF